jgi:T3SS (YopN, CesT) and YbjN peptide-binding chaperone 1/T3SS (YopN, CesT) and YbjN peptide-binding chaperone 3
MAENLPEAGLLDEPTTADLGAKVAEAWREFARSLAAVVPSLPEAAHLDVTLDPTASGTGHAVYGVSIERTQEGVSALAVSNANLPEGYRLDRASVAAMVALGWAPPGVMEGSGESFGLEGTADAIATVITRTLRDVYGAPHPAFLVYAARGKEDEALTIEPLAPARHESTMGGLPPVDGLGADGLDLADRVRIVVATLTKTDPDKLTVDADGDIGIRAGSAMVFVRVRDNPPLIDVFSPVLTEIEPTEQLFVRLSELTNRMPIGRLYCTSGTVWASVPVFGRDFQPTHLSLAIQVMTGLADELDDRLHGEFGGKRFFVEGDKSGRSSPNGPDERIGQYL